VLFNREGKVVADIRDLLYDAEYSNELGDSMVTLKILQKRTLWFPKTLAVQEIRLSRDTELTHVDTQIQPDHGKEVYLEFTVKRVGSRLFDSRASGQGSSNTVRF